MCGLAGLYSPEQIVDTTLVRKMLDRISHRGPDASGVWQDDSVCLGHRRLAIRGLSTAANQPFFSANGRYVTIYNGEIYNDSDLADKLARENGFIKKTDTDTEIIAEAYDCWGLEAFSLFEGMFALALWDRRERELILARDGIGIKPLYIDEADGFFFASEVKALLAANRRRYRLSPPDIDHLLALGYVGPSSTLVKGIRQLKPGTVAVVGRQGYKEYRFWSPKRKAADIPFEEALEKFTFLFSDTVKKHLVSDVPIGILQSGGIDSSLVTCALPRDFNIPLFSVRFPGLDHDESPLAAKLAAARGREVVWIDLPRGADAEGDFRAVVDGLDGQIADSSALAAYALSRAVRTRVKVVLSGDGGDEFFAGYPTYPATIFARRLTGAVPAVLARRAARTVRKFSGLSMARVPFPEKISRFFEGVAHPVPHAVWRHYLAGQDRYSLYGPALGECLAHDPFEGYAQAYLGAEGEALDKALSADQTYYLPADMLVKVDRMSMAHGLEVRVPFLGINVMGLANSLPGAALLGKGNQTKRILRAALAELGAPKEVWAARKSGFNVPMNLLLRRELRRLVEFYLVGHPEIYEPYLLPQAVRQMARNHLAAKMDSKYIIWTLLTIAVWRDREGV